MENVAGLLLLSLRLGLAILLFLFLYWAIRIIWKDFSKMAKEESFNIIPPIYLTINKKDHDTHAFTVPEVIIGRGPSCDFRISDETVSSMHARLFFNLNQWWVEDYGSSNGTFLNEINLATAAVLTQGDQLQLGKININISFSE
ncbi:MAG: FHA domain-containing protein [Anaerolineales bacterium]